jgi:hypothetical protein
MSSAGAGPRLGSEDPRVVGRRRWQRDRRPATFVYAGIEVERCGLFAGPRGSQIASRFATIATTPFAYGTPAQRQAWNALLATLEQTLRLRAHRPGTLVGLAAYLHQRTAGMIGSLSHLIRGAAIDAIITGEEKITKAGLDGVRARSRRRTPTRREDGPDRTDGAAAGRRGLMQPRPLPVSVPLVRAETIDSYLARLASANHLPLTDFRAHLGLPPTRNGRVDLNRLSAMTGHEPDRLSDLVVGAGPWPARARMPPLPASRSACRRCTAARGSHKTCTGSPQTWPSAARTNAGWVLSATGRAGSTT